MPSDRSDGEATAGGDTASAVRDAEATATSDGGDAACWLGHLCPHCGAMPERTDGPCWRCGRSPDAVRTR